MRPRSITTKAKTLPWWSGKWRSDPALRLPPSSGLVGLASLRRVAEILSGSPIHFFPDGRLLPELLEELWKLPAGLAVEAVEVLSEPREPRMTPLLQPLLSFVLDREGGPAAFERLLGRWGAGGIDQPAADSLRAAARAASAAARQELCLRLLPRALAAPFTVRTSEESGPAHLAAKIVGHIWPAGANVTPLLDAVLALATEELGTDLTDRVREDLADVLSLACIDPTPILDRVVEAQVQGCPGPWALLRPEVDTLLQSAPCRCCARPPSRRCRATTRPPCNGPSNSS